MHLAAAAAAAEIMERWRVMADFRVLVVVVVKSGGGSGGNGTIKITYTLPDNPTISLSSTSTSTCYSASAQNATIAYTATSGCPDKYSIDFTSGISDVTDASLSASPITIPILAGLAAGEYFGTLTVKNSSYGFRK